MTKQAEEIAFIYKRRSLLLELLKRESPPLRSRQDLYSLVSTHQVKPQIFPDHSCGEKLLLLLFFLF